MQNGELVANLTYINNNGKVVIGNQEFTNPANTILEKINFNGKTIENDKGREI